MRTPVLAAVLATVVPAALVPAARAQSPLSFRTSHEPSAQWVLGAFASHAELPALAAGQHWELALDDGGQLGVRARPGDVDVLECTVRPGALMELFADRIRAMSPMLQGSFAIGLAGIGVATKEAVVLFRALLAFPGQIAEARLRFDGAFESLRDLMHGVTTLEVEPAAGTWFERLVRSLRHHPAGPPGLGDDSPHLAFLWAAEVGDQGVLEPFTEFFASLFGDAGISRHKRIRMVEEMWASGDGTLAMTYDYEHQSYRLLQGIADAERLRKLYEDADLIAWLEAQYQAMFQLDPSVEELKFVPNGFEYRGVTMHETILLGEDGESFGADGLAGPWAISCQGLRREDIRALVDRVLDGRVRRTPLPEGALCAVRLRHMSEWDLNHSGRTLQGMPDRIDLTLGKTATGLVLRLEVE